MALEDDGDPIRGLGFVALNAAYLEEQIDNLLFMLQPVEALRKLSNAGRLAGRSKRQDA